MHGKVQTEVELHVALYLQTLRIHVLEIQKIRIKILQIANDVYYNGVKFQYKILHIVGYRKITNSDKFCSE